MDISEKVNDTLSQIFDHYYDSMPEFAEGEEPDTYAVYSVRDRPENFASGVYHAKTYWISLSIITLSYDRELYRQTEEAFVIEGFIYSGGTDMSGYEGSEPCPQRHQHIQEYLIFTDLEV